MPAFPHRAWFAGNPLSADPVLFNEYMNALDVVLAESELREAFDEFALPAAALRNKMVSEAEQILGSAPAEFAAYQAAIAAEFSEGVQITHGSRRSFAGIIRLLWMSIAGPGALLLAVGGPYWLAWPWRVALL